MMYEGDRMADISKDEYDKIAAELQAARTRLAELEEKADSEAYKAKWWIDKRKQTEFEKKLFPTTFSLKTSSPQTV